MTTFNRKIARTIKELDIFKRDFTYFLIETKIDPDILSQIELAAYEVIINVIDHTITENSSDPISFNCEITESKIICKVDYSGEEFDISRANLPDVVKHFKEGKNRGLGVYIIRTLMDSVQYAYQNNINSLTLEKSKTI